MDKKQRNNEFNKAKQSLDDSFESLLNGDDFMEDSVDPMDSDLPQVTPNSSHDYTQMKSSASEKAKKTITALMKFYLDEDIIEKDQYVIARKRIDEMTLSSLMFQLETAEQALVTLLRTIDSGELAPRMFEVLGTLQKSMLDIIKSQTMYLVAAEESVKKLSRDVEIFTDRKNKKLNQDNRNQGQISNVNRGTKSLMEEIQNEIKDTGYENVDGLEEINPEDVE
tara:strand:+ start:2652 stop:3323 length:672 start_codon:yes stop_codon:yes gene_type:complete